MAQILGAQVSLGCVKGPDLASFCHKHQSCCDFGGQLSPLLGCPWLD